MARKPRFLDAQGRAIGLEESTVSAAAASAWQGLPIDARSLKGSVEIGAIGIAFPTIALCTGGAGYNEVRFGRSSARLPFKAGVLALQEAGFELSGAVRHGHADEIVIVQLPPDALAELNLDGAEPLQLRTRMPFEDDTLAGLILAMRDELGRGSNSGRMFAQGLSLALVGYLRSHHGMPAPARRHAGRLSAGEMARIVDYVMLNMARDIGVDDLASLLHLSCSQFSRLFRASAGVSPYRYLQQKRIEHALELMRGPDSLSEIAQNVGLATQSHFTQVFRQLTGVTPSQARRALRGS